MYYPCSETKALISFASLFSHMQKSGFLTTRLLCRYLSVVSCQITFGSDAFEVELVMAVALRKQIAAEMTEASVGEEWSSASAVEV